ncbi:hypothetical protein [Citrobacter meridianamericanus]|uniref:hypothetical protein n=1 Tax=Citrobacter meridianamericanus TaxID=2894201 RepID=UPI00351D0E6A
MNITTGFKLKAVAAAVMAGTSGSALAAGTPPDPSTFITTAMLEAISNPILVTMGAVVTAAFGILTFKLVVSVGMGVIKSFFAKAAQ